MVLGKVNPNIQQPFLDFHAIIFIGRSTEAIESVTWKMVWCLGGDGEECDAYPSPIAGDRELHFCIYSKRESSCCSAVAEGGGNSFLFPLPDCYLSPYVKPGNCFKGPGAVLAVIFIILMLCCHP